MNVENHILNMRVVFAAVLVGSALFVGLLSLFEKPLPATAAVFNSQSNNTPPIASSTAFALTFGATSTQILATSTASTTDPTVGGRMALSLQTNNCGTGGMVYLNFGDRLAATNTVRYITASSSLVLGDEIPMVHGSIRAMSAYANCTLLVTEFRTEYF